jgi:transmembrane sensor
MKTGKLNKNIKDLLAKSILRDLSDKEHIKLMDSSEVRAMMFKQWEENIDIKAKVKTPDYDKIFNRITARKRLKLNEGGVLEIQKYKKKYNNLRKSYLLYSRAAAILFILLLTAGALYISNSPGRNTVSELIAPRGQKSKAILEDGTIVWLNSGSSIRYTNNYNKRNREIDLTGEAYFEVSSNKKLPFVVKSAELIIKALGTTFNLMAYPEDEAVGITLIEGKVQVIAPGSKIIYLSPNQKAIYNKSDNSLIIEKVDPVFSISWKDNVLKFDDQPLPEILTHLERWYDVKFYYPENVLNDQRFTMTIKTESLKEVLELIKISTPIRFKIDVDSVYITLMN